MRPGRRSLLFVLLFAALLAAVSVWAGSFENPEISDPVNDTQTSAESGAWADLRRVWLVETPDALEFHINVTTLDGHDGGERWDVNFTINGTNWTARATYDGSAFSSQIRENGTQVGGAETSVFAANDTIQVNWSSYRADVGNATLEKLFALADDGNVLPVNDLPDCHGQDAIDCAPDSGFGRSFRIGERPAEGLSLNVTPNRTRARPGTNVTFQLFANNSDDDPVPNASYNVTVPDGFDASVNTTNFTLEPGDSDQRPLVVEVGDNVTTNATHAIQVHLVPSQGRNRSETVEIFVPPPAAPPPPFNLSMTILPPRREVRPGATTTFEVEVTNDGTDSDIVDLEVVSGPGWAVLSERKLRLASGGNATVTVEVPVPEDADDGTYDHRIQATSSGNPNVTASATATVEVERPGGFVNELDRQLEALGLGGLVPALVLLGILLVIVIVLLGALLGGSEHDVAVEAGWSEGGPEEDDEGGDEGG